MFLRNLIKFLRDTEAQKRRGTETVETVETVSVEHGETECTRRMREGGGARESLSRISW